MLKPSRSMISGELSWAVFAFLLGWAGGIVWPFDEGWLSRRVAEHMWPIVWAAMFVLPAVTLLWYSLVEWHSHCTWTMAETDRSSRIRGVLALTLLPGWIYAAYILLPASRGLSVIGTAALAGVAFMLWFYKENRRVQRDVRKQTAAFRIAA